MNQLHKKMIIINIIEKGGIKQWETPIDSIQDQIKDSIAKIEYPGIKRVYFFKGDEKEQEYIDYLKEIQPSLGDAKQQKFDAVDKRTQELIFKGFAFGNCHWSLSITAQINWSNIPNIPDTLFPMQMQDQNGIDYKLQLIDKMNFYLTAVGTKNQYLQSGNRLCSQIDALQTVDEVLNFIDPR